jgi:hypothetical protein
MAPEEAHRRRLSIDAGVLGLDPTRRCAGFPVTGTAFLASISSARAWASSSPIEPAAWARQSNELTWVSPDRGDASTAWRSWVANMRFLSGQRPAEEASQDHGTAPPSPEMTFSGLTQGRIFGEDHVAKH